MTHIDEAARDEILFAFQLAHPHPTSADVAAWVARHPDLRAAIMEHAASLLEADLGGAESAPPSEAMLARGRSVTLDLLHRSRQAANEAPQTPTGASLIDLLSSAGKTLPALAREIDAGRGMLTDFFSGRMAPPVRVRLANAVSRALGVTVVTMSAAYEATLAAPVAARAKADDQAVARRRGYDEIVATDATMTDERKAFWLGED